MLVKVLMYAYATGVFSSRKVAKRLYEDVAFRVLAAGNFPVPSHDPGLLRPVLGGALRTLYPSGALGA